MVAPDTAQSESSAASMVFQPFRNPSRTSNPDFRPLGAAIQSGLKRISEFEAPNYRDGGARVLNLMSSNSAFVSGLICRDANFTTVG